MTDLIEYERKGQNYMVVTRNGKMIAQIMEDGMFGEGNAVVIDNFGQTLKVNDEDEAKAAIDEIIASGRLEAGIP
jgi:hypothetical protein